MEPENFMLGKKVSQPLSTSPIIMAAVLIMTVVFAPGAWAASKYKTLYKFTGGADGDVPVGGLIFDAAGDIYGIAASGGNGDGVVYELTPKQDGSWKERVIYRFAGGTDGSDPGAGLTFDHAGNLFGTTYFGGAQNVGTIFELTPNSDGSWKESVLYSFCSLTHCSDGANPLAGLIFDQDGDLYGTTSAGGAYGWGSVFELTPNAGRTWEERVLHHFTGGKDGFYPSAGLIFDNAGKLYGTTNGSGEFGCSGTSCGVIFELKPSSNGQWTEKVLHTFNGKDGRNPYAGLIFDHGGNLYGTTVGSGNGTVFKLTPNRDGSWTENVLSRFTRRQDGQWPYDSLTFDQVGNLYSVTLRGGSLNKCSGYGCGVVFKLAPNPTGGWNETVLHDFLDLPGFGPFGALIFDAAGNLYGTTSGNRPTTHGSVFEITR
jgi:uncharacterized repeat protein (TIGR03803 family)